MGDVIKWPAESDVKAVPSTGSVVPIKTWTQAVRPGLPWVQWRIELSADYLKKAGVAQRDMLNYVIDSDHLDEGTIADISHRLLADTDLKQFYYDLCDIHLHDQQHKRAYEHRYRGRIPGAEKELADARQQIGDLLRNGYAMTDAEVRLQIGKAEAEYDRCLQQQGLFVR